MIGVSGRFYAIMKNRLTTHRLFLGSPEAEVENSRQPISKVFEDYTGIVDAINSGHFLICGRKGSGKSAYAVCQDSLTNRARQVFTTIVRRNDFAIDELLNDAAITDKTRSVLFEWIILVRLVKLILDSKIGESHSKVKSLAKFYERNAGHCEIDRYTIAEILRENEVNFAPLKADYGVFRRLFSTKEIKAPFYKMITPLRECVAEVLRMEIFRAADFKVIFDDLDVRFKLGNQADCDMLTDLIQTVKSYNTTYLLGTPAKVIMLLRDDIWKHLEGRDGALAKTVSSAAHFIKWYTNTNDDGTDSPLRKLINKRLVVGMQRLGIDWSSKTDPWKSFVVDFIDCKYSFKYILDFTFYLPRDLLTIFKDIDSKDLKLPLSSYDIDELITAYSFEKKRELSDELAALYSPQQIKDIFDLLEAIYHGNRMAYDDVVALLNDHGFGLDDLDNLIEYNLVVPIDQTSGHLFFNYRERVPKGALSTYGFSVPKILVRYFSKR